MSLKYLYLIENVDNDLICLLKITKIICSCWLTVGFWIMFVVFLNKTFRWFKYVCIKKWTYKISARFHSLTEMARDRNDQDRNGSNRIGQTRKSRTPLENTPAPMSSQCVPSGTHVYELTNSLPIFAKRLWCS